MNKKIIKIVLLSCIPLLADIDMQKGFYDAAEEMMRFDEKMNQLIAEHNNIGFEEDKEMRLNDIALEDFKETSNGYELSQNIDDSNNIKIDVKVEDGRLSILTTVTQKKEIMMKEETISETTISSSQVSFPIPNNADEQTMTNSFKNGVLVIKFNKK